MKPLQIGDKLAKLPLIQGGMGVGVSLSRLAGAVARAGGIGIISTAQIGFREADFQKDTKAANLRAMVAELKKARDIAADADDKCQGLIGYKYHGCHEGLCGLRKNGCPRRRRCDHLRCRSAGRSAGICDRY